MFPIGRDAELALVADRLRDRRLVTVVGPGEIGKTSLARAAATATAGDYGQGVVHVDLTRIDTADGLNDSKPTPLCSGSFADPTHAPGHRAHHAIHNTSETGVGPHSGTSPPQP